MPAPEFRTFKDVEEEAKKLIEALDASAHSQGKKAASWRETSIPFTVLQSASNLGHLLFDVWIPTAPNSELSRGAEVGGDEESVTISAQLKVQFSYKLRGSQQKKDARQGTVAAHDVVRALMAPWDYDTNGCVDLLLVNPLIVNLTLDGEWLLVQQDYIVEFQLDTSAPTAP